MSLYPVSHRSTRNAVREVVGGKAANYAVWNRYLGRTIENRPELWAAIDIVATYRTRSAKIAKSEVPFQDSSYAGGAFIFLAAVENQARHLGVTIKELSEDDLLPWKRATMVMSLTDEEEANINAAIYNTTRDEDLQKLRSASISEHWVIRGQVADANAASFENSPFAEAVAEPLSRVATESLHAARIAVDNFLEAEPNFTSFMNDMWWNDSLPPITFSQQVGAADMRGLLQSAGVE